MMGVGTREKREASMMNKRPSEGAQVLELRGKGCKVELHRG